MKICDHVTEKCFEPVGAWKNPCPHAIAHEPTIECVGTQCQRFAHEEDTYERKLIGIVYMKHVEI